MNYEGLEKVPRSWATYTNKIGETFTDLDELCLILEGLEGKQLEISKFKMVELSCLAERFLEILYYRDEKCGTRSFGKDSFNGHGNSDMDISRKGQTMKDLNWLALEITVREEGKEQVDIAQIKEVLGKLGEILSELENDEVNNLLNKLIEAGQKD